MIKFKKIIGLGFKKTIGIGLSFINWILPNPPGCNQKLIIPVIESSPLAEDDTYLLLKDAKFVIGEAIFTVKKGFAWDGASIPSFAWQIVGTPYYPKFMAASCLHDYMYVKTLGRKNADLYFYWILIESGVSQKIAEKMYYAVRVGGKKPYEKYSKS